MFEAGVDLEDPEAIASQFWAMGHGITMLVLTGVLPRGALDDHAPTMAAALFVAAGDHEVRSRAAATLWASSTTSFAADRAFSRCNVVLEGAC